MTVLSNNTKKDIQRNANRLEEFADDATQNVHDIAKETGKAVRQYFNDKTDQAVELRKNTEQKIVENPLKAVAVAAVGGLILGALLRR